MKVIRNNIFETNSSSSHSLTIEKVERSSTRVGKLEQEKTYYYTPMGSEVGSTKYTKIFSSEYEKLCVMFDLLWSYFYNSKYEHFEVSEKEYKEREDMSLSRYDCTLEKIYKAFQKSIYYCSFFNVVNMHKFLFIVNKEDILHRRTSKYNKNIISDDETQGYSLLYNKFKFLGVNSYFDLINRIVFDPSITLKYVFKRG